MSLTKPNCWPKLSHKIVQNHIIQKLLDIGLLDQFWQRSHNLVYKNPNAMKSVKNFPKDINLQYWYLDQNPKIKGTSSIG